MHQLLSLFTVITNAVNVTSGHVDFNDSTQYITFFPFDNYKTVHISIFDDEINEAEEGFMILLELVDSNLADSVDLLSRNCTLGRIDDNDRKYFLFFCILKSVLLNSYVHWI